VALKDIRKLRGVPPQKRINYKRLVIICLPLVVATFLFVYFFRYMADTQPKKIVVVERNTISILYPGDDGKLSEKIIDIDANITQKDKGSAIIAELKRIGVVPQNLVLQEMVIDSEGIIYLNFTKDLLYGDKEDDAGIVYAIVNSFVASFRSAKKVQFLVDWKPVYTLRGTVYTYLPIEFNKHVMED